RAESAGSRRTNLARAAKARRRKPTDRGIVPGRGRCGKSVAGCSLRRARKGTRYGRRIRLESWGTIGNFTSEKNHCGGRRSRARRYRIGLAKRNSGVGGGCRFGDKGFRAEAGGGGDRDPDVGNLRADQSLALEAAQSGRRNSGTAR